MHFGPVVSSQDAPSPAEDMQVPVVLPEAILQNPLELQAVYAVSAPHDSPGLASA